MQASDLEFVRPLVGGGGTASVDLVRAEGREWVLKRHRPRDMAAERLFHRTLRENGLPALYVADCDGLSPDQLLLEFVAGSPTIGGAPAPELCRRWGEAVGRLHRIHAPAFCLLDEAGAPQPADWRDFLATQVRVAIERQRRLATDLPSTFLQRAEDQLARLPEFEPSPFVVTHGDLHLNNALVRSDGIVLFDKPADVWVAPAVFDLCLIFSEAFPGARYGAAREGDEERLAAFLDGYGKLPREEIDWIEYFVLLRSLRRYPSPFVPELRSIIELALARLAEIKPSQSSA
jgi:Ser/Thr protein kinase RdoA (MazF antagonist)